MNAPSFSPDMAGTMPFEWINAALDILSARGITIDVEQRIRVVSLLSRLSASEPGFSPERLGGLLTPILASSPEEQRVCLEVFGTIQPTRSSIQAPAPARETGSEKDTTSPVKLSEGQPLVRKVSIGLALLVLAYLLYWAGSSLVGRQSSSPQIPATYGTTIPALQIEWLRNYPLEEIEPPRQTPWNRTLRWFYTEYDFPKWLALVVPWLLTAALLYWMYRKLMAQIRREALRESLRVLDLPLRAASFRFGDRRLISKLQPLRRLARAHLRVFDVERTALSSAAYAGLLRPQYQDQPVMTDFVALIDRQSARDHLADFNRHVCQTLTDAGLNVEVLEFDHDPSLCRVYRTGEYLPLKAAVGRFADAVLLVFADAVQFIEPSTGTLYPSLHVLGDARRVVLMTPYSRGAHTELESALCIRLGLIVARTSPEEMHRLVDVLLEHQRRPRRQNRNGQSQANPHIALAEFIAERPERWSQTIRPNGNDLDILRRMLRDSLGTRTMRLLGATSVYPELRWLLTLSFRSILNRAEEPSGRTAGDFLHLCRLPWFRRGWMPKWVRNFVQQCLTETEEKAVRRSMLELIGVMKRPGGRSDMLDVHAPVNSNAQAVRPKVDRATIEYLLPSILRSSLELLIPASWLARISSRVWRRFAKFAVAGVAGGALLSVLALSFLPIDECDLLAAAPSDPMRIGPGMNDTALDVLFGTRAKLACEQALKRKPGNGRYWYQLSRALNESNPVGSHEAVLKAYERGYLAALNSLGFDYMNGRGVAVDLERAEHYLRMAAEHGYSLAVHNLADIAANRGNRAKEFELRKQAFAMGSNLVFDLATIYDEGELVPEDDAKYLELLKMGVSRGDYESATRLGWEYDAGSLQDEPNSAAKANELYRLAIRLGGEMGAANNLALNYQYGYGIEKSYERATYWYIFAAKQGYSESLTRLGMLILDGKAVFANGHGPDKNFTGDTFLRTAAESGNANAEYEYAKWLESEASESPDGRVRREEAISWYSKAAMQGHDDALNALKRLGIDPK